MSLVLQSSGFGWFSWFRSKPTNASPSADEDSSDSQDSEVTGGRAGKLPLPWVLQGTFPQQWEGSALALDSTPVPMKQVL